MMEVVFSALVKKIEIKSLVSGDKSARVILEIDSPDDDLVDKINRCMSADGLVQVAMVKENT